jgi:V8-like Glu-specific endopeptidase
MPSVYPYSCVGLLIVEFKGGVIYRNGFLIGNNLVMTAASNIFDK